MCELKTDTSVDSYEWLIHICIDDLLWVVFSTAMLGQLSEVGPLLTVYILFLRVKSREID